MAGDELTLSATIRAAPATVWRLLTERRDEWWPDMRFAAEPGAPLREEWTERGQLRFATGVVTESRPDIALAFEWQQAEWEAPLSVAISLTPEAEGTLLRLRETGFAGLGVGERLLDEHLEGWRFHLANLTGHAESDPRERVPLN